jgi:Na+-translocating ferredoxin:NAD+ oxidoreductase RnfA subunit
VTAVQVIAISSLVSYVINQWLLPSPNLAYGIQIGVFLTTALLVRAFRNQ